MSDFAAIMARRRQMEESGEAPTIKAESSKRTSTAPGGPAVSSPTADAQLQSAMARRREIEEKALASPSGGGASSSKPAASASTKSSAKSSKPKSTKGGSSLSKKRPPRLYVEGAVLGYTRGQRNQHEGVSLVKIKNVESTEDAHFYCGKKVAFVTKQKSGKFRVNWGKVCRPHGSNGVVRCRFRRNLPPQAMGGRVRVMLYPSSI